MELLGLRTVLGGRKRRVTVLRGLVCNLGLMFFPDPVRGLSEIRRVLITADQM